MADDPILSRDLLAKHFGGDKRMIAEFESVALAAQEASSSIPATVALKDATVIVLSSSGEFTNERLLEVGDGIEIEITDTAVRLSVKDVARTQDFGATFVPPAEVLLFLPPEGTLVSAEAPAMLENKVIHTPMLANIPNHADDAAAAAGGVVVGQMYRTGSALKVRAA